MKCAASTIESEGIPFVRTCSLAHKPFPVRSTVTCVGGFACLIEPHDAIGTQLHRGVTMMKVVGAYSGLEHTMLLCACSNSEGYRVKKLVYSIDPKALIMISPNDEVFGEGFKSPED